MRGAIELLSAFYLSQVLYCEGNKFVLVAAMEEAMVSLPPFAKYKLVTFLTVGLPVWFF